MVKERYVCNRIPGGEKVNIEGKVEERKSLYGGRCERERIYTVYGVG